MNDDIQTLSIYRRDVEQTCSAWPSFFAKRATRLELHARHGKASEKVAENIFEVLFTGIQD